jgi:PadR family transcriptional regulator AphA
VNYRLVENTYNRYIECLSDGIRIASERDALDLVAACGENQAHRLLLYGGNLADDFYRLKTGLAGAVLLKFAVYSIKVAAVLTPELVDHGRFREMVLEANRSNRNFHVFFSRENAEEWLVKE